MKIKLGQVLIFEGHYFCGYSTTGAKFGPENHINVFMTEPKLVGSTHSHIKTLQKPQTVRSGGVITLEHYYTCFRHQLAYSNVL